MKALFGCFLSAFLASVSCCSFAQTGPSSIKGAILTENGTGVEYATVILLKYADSSIVRSTISSKTGLFLFEDIQPGTYMIFVHKIGYRQLYTGKYQLNDTNTDIGNLVLRPSDNYLQEVTVTDKRNYIEVLPDKTVLNIDKSILAAGNSVYDILNTAPGVRVVDNTILFKGGQKPLITINGKPVNAFSDEQLADLLKSYQSAMVSQIELIENPSAKYDAAGSGGVINIILKKNNNTGFDGNFTLSGATGQDYKSNTGVNLNYNTQKLKLFGGLNFADNKIQRFLDLDRNIYDNNQPSDYNLNYRSTSAEKDYSFNAGADYDITPGQTIGALMYGYSDQTGIDKNNITYIQNNGVPDSDITTVSHIDRHITNINYNLDYKGNFVKSYLSADFDYSTYHSNSPELLQSDFFTESGQTYRAPLFYSNNSPLNITVRAEDFNFTQLLSKTGSLTAGLKNSQVHSDNNTSFEQRADTGVFVPVPALTDHFIYNERINAAYLNYKDKFNKTGLTIGLRAEQTNSSGRSVNSSILVNSKYVDFFPSVQVMQPLDTDNSLNIGYNRRINRPKYQYLDPYVAYIDQYAYSTGNPYLKPEYTDAYEVTNVYKNKYKVTLSIIKTSNFYISLFQQNDSTKVYTTIYKNIGWYYQYMSEFWVPVTINNWWKADIYFEAAFDRFVYNNNYPGKSTGDMSLNVNQNFTITGKLKAELSVEYDSPTYYGISNIKSFTIVGAGISQDILHNRGGIKLAISDIFNADEYRYSSHYLNIDLTGRQKPGTRFVNTTFTYRFGRQAAKDEQKHAGNNGDEQSRLGGGNEN